jgi:hypothetical protein
VNRWSWIVSVNRPATVSANTSSSEIVLSTNSGGATKGTKLQEIRMEAITDVSTAPTLSTYTVAASPPSPGYSPDMVHGLGGAAVSCISTSAPLPGTKGGIVSPYTGPCQNGAILKK